MTTTKEVHIHIPKRVRHRATGTLHTVIGLVPDADSANAPEVITWGDPAKEENLGGDTWCGPLRRFEAEFDPAA